MGMFGTNGHAIKSSLDKEGVLGCLDKVDPGSSLLGVGMVRVGRWSQMIKRKGDTLGFGI